jgi:ABC-type spermidine/putrescine transport system permease subunit II
MTTLQEATYYSALIFCSLAILSIVIGSIAGLVVLKKVNKTKRKINEKLNIVSNLPYISKHVLRAVKENIK